MEQRSEQGSDGMFFIEVNHLMKKVNLSGDTDKECLENGELEECLNQQSNV